jgi:hypothetical protein
MNDNTVILIGKGTVSLTKTGYFCSSENCITQVVVSKIFWTGAAIYTAVVVARSTGRW